MDDRDNGADAEEFDLVVIGTGEGGSAPAIKCREAGWKVAVVDREPFGGTCALRGCDPKKVLVGAAELVDWHRRMQGHGVDGHADVVWPALMRFKESFTASVPERREARLRDSGITTFHGEATFEARDRLAVGGPRLHAKHIVIAAGAGPRLLGIPGEERLLTSTQFLSLNDIPRRLVLVGAGYIAFEFAHIAARSGMAVTMVGRTPLRRFDESLVARLVEHTRSLDIDVKLETEVTGVEAMQTNGGLRVHCRRGGSAFWVDTDIAVHAAGRVPSIDALEPQRGEVKLDRHGAIEVNEYLQSLTNPRVYAAGDVTRPPGKLPLTPVAAHEGAIVASNLLHGNVKQPDYRATPSVVFTVPPLASVGLTERDARDQGLDIVVKAGDTSDWYTNRRTRSPVGAFKTLTDKKTGRLVGAHLFGERADEMINLLALAIRFDVPLTELKHALYAYPSAGADLQYML